MTQRPRQADFLIVFEEVIRRALCNLGLKLTEDLEPQRGGDKAEPCCNPHYGPQSLLRLGLKTQQIHVPFPLCADCFR